MAEPTGITTNVALIYSADLMYEQNCKCGTIQVLTEGEIWEAGDGDKVWRIDILFNGDGAGRPGRVLGDLIANNISAQDCVKLAGCSYINGQIIMGDFIVVSVSTPGAFVILYKDCRQS